MYLIIIDLGPKVPVRKYFKAQVYTNEVHGPLGLDFIRVNLRALGLGGGGVVGFAGMGGGGGEGGVGDRVLGV